MLSETQTVCVVLFLVVMMLGAEMAQSTALGNVKGGETFYRRLRRS